MKRITNDEVFDLLAEICGLLATNDLPYLVYGSTAYVMVTGDDIEVHDVDLVVRQADFERICNLIEEANLELKPIRTPVSIHANSNLFSGTDDQPFDVSLDSYEHYFEGHGIDLSRYKLLGPSLRVMEVSDPS